MPNKFFIKTTLEWASTSMNSYIIPRGDLCIETFDDGNMKLKIGDGLRVFKQLPYICHGHDDKKYDYYTKEEIDKMFDDITIDLNNYYNKIEIDQFMTSLRSDLIQYIDNNTHYHHNKAILDQITAPFTREEKEKLANIIDVSGYAERIEVLESIAHTHDNKNVLDLITLADVNNWHVHSNKTILDNTTASFTVNYKNILDNLVTYSVFEPASAYESGSVGLVPAPNVGDHVKFLRGDGKWVSIEVATIPIATTETLGGVIIGDGIDVDENGVISVSGGSGSSYIAGTGISIDEREIIDGMYERLVYIESDGTQYIDTGYCHNPDDWYCLTCTFIEDDNEQYEVALGANDFDGSKQTNLLTLWSRYNGATVNYELNDTGTQSSTSFTTSTLYNTKIDNYLFRNTINIHDADTNALIISRTLEKSLYSITGHPSLTLMGRHWYSTTDDEEHYDSFSKLRIYRFRIWPDYEHTHDDDTRDESLIADYVPVKRLSDSKIGLYDVISKTFVTSTVGNDLTYRTTGGTNKVINNTGVLDIENVYDVLNITFADSTKSIKLYNPGDGIEFENSSSGSTSAPRIKYFRFDITKIRGNNQWVQMEELEFSHNGTVIRGTGVSIVGYKFDGSTPTYSTTGGNQTPAQLIDNDLNTKMCARFDDDQHSYIKIILSINGEGISPNEVFQYQYFTGDDEPNRDPVSWVVYASADGIRWTLLDQRDDATINTTRRVPAFDKITLDMTDYINAYADATFTNINVKPATTTDIGGVIIGNGINVDEDGVISVDSHDVVEYLDGDAIELRDVSVINAPFIRFNGSTSVFDTGVIHQAHDKFEVILREPTVSNKNRTVFGSRIYNIDSNDITLTIDTNQKFAFDRSSTARTILASTNVVSTDIIYKIIIQDKSCDIYNYETGELIEHIGDAEEWVLDDGLYTLSIGNVHNRDYMQHSNLFGDMELYEFKWYRNDELIHDYVPYQNDSLIALYDNVTESVLQAYAGANGLTYGTREIHISDLGSDKTINVLYADGLAINDNNQLYTTGVLDVSVNPTDDSKLNISFWDEVKTIKIAGTKYIPGEAINISTEGLDSNYIEIEYIETYNPNNTIDFSYFDTGYIPGPTTNIELVIASSRGNTEYTPVGIARYDNGSYATHVFGIAWNSTTGKGVWFNRADQTSNYGGQYVELSEDVRNKKTTFKTIGNTLYVYNENGDLLGSVTDPDAFTANAPYSLPIFVSKIHGDSPYSNDFMYGKFYELYIREGDELVHHFIPCKTADQTAFGIYDVITKSFRQISRYGTGGQINLGPEVSERTFETKINVLYNDGLDVNDDNELINTGVLDVNVNEQDSSKLDIEFYDHTKTITIPGGSGGSGVIDVRAKDDDTVAVLEVEKSSGISEIDLIALLQGLTINDNFSDDGTTISRPIINQQTSETANLSLTTTDAITNAQAVIPS